MSITMRSIVAVLLLALFGLAYSEPRRNASFVETVKDIVHDGRKAVGESVVDMGEKVKEAMEEFIDESDDYLDGEDNTTEPMGIDSEGCNRGLRKSLEDKCDADYDKVNEEAQQIEDEKKKLEAVCCALEDFEKCSLRAFDKANCAADKIAIRENLRAARLFLSVVANITCNEFRGQCAYYASGASHSYYFGLYGFFLASGGVVMTLLV